MKPAKPVFLLALSLSLITLTAHAASWEEVVTPKVNAYCDAGHLRVNALSLDFSRANGERVQPDLVWFDLDLHLVGNELIAEQTKKHTSVSLGTVEVDESNCASGKPYSVNAEIKLHPGVRLLYTSAVGHCHYDFWSWIPLPIPTFGGQRTTYYRPKNETFKIETVHQGELRSKTYKGQLRYVDRAACHRSN